MTDEDTNKVEERGDSTGSASERALELLIKKVSVLDGFTCEAAEGLRALFAENREVSGNEILSVVLPDEEEEGQADAVDQED